MLPHNRSNIQQDPQEQRTRHAGNHNTSSSAPFTLQHQRPSAAAYKAVSTVIQSPTLVSTNVVKMRATFPARFSMQVAMDSSPELPLW